MNQVHESSWTGFTLFYPLFFDWFTLKVIIHREVSRLTYIRQGYQLIETAYKKIIYKMVRFKVTDQEYTIMF